MPEEEEEEKKSSIIVNTLSITTNINEEYIGKVEVHGQAKDDERAIKEPAAFVVLPRLFVAPTY